jgi:NAD(P)-dependent dehydrogenase (short-subunit alcohol dehydrogenase family)
MSLEGKVALVAGATRGAGRGIAVELGAAGATVYVTGRTTRDRQSEYARPETIEETAELVAAAGGNGIAVRVDHLVADEVAKLVDGIRAEQGRLDVLVNDMWGGENLKEWNKPVWEHDLRNGLRMLSLGVHTHLITAHHALPLLIERAGGLLVEVTDGTAEYNADHHRINPFYDLAKVAVTRMAWAHAQDLAPHGATSVSITPGWLRSEMMLEAFGVTEESWRDAATKVPHFVISETPASSGARLRRLRPTRIARVGTGNRFPAASWRRSMALPMSTAPAPTPGGTCVKSRIRESPPTPPAIDRLTRQLAGSRVDLARNRSAVGLSAKPWAGRRESPALPCHPCLCCLWDRVLGGPAPVWPVPGPRLCDGAVFWPGADGASRQSVT